MSACWCLGVVISPSSSPCRVPATARLLEAGVRVFEWNGSMLHAKTAVADGRWARVGSSNLNVASWIGNWELDVAVEDEAFAQAMQEMYLDDLTHATELVLSERQRIRPSGHAMPSSAGSRPRSGSAGRVAAGALSVSNTIGAAIINRRVLGPAEAKIMVCAGLVLLIIAALATLWPLLLVVPFDALGRLAGDRAPDPSVSAASRGPRSCSPPPTWC